MKRLITILIAGISLSLPAAKLPAQWQIADRELADYFRRETRAMSEKCLSGINSADDWKQHAPEFRAQLGEMLGLSPMPPRTDLHATVTKRFEGDSFTVENLHFQSRPGLYVTANLYVPKNLMKPAPTILYVCGHSPVVTNKTSYGTKAAYQHWGSWFARNGYVCMIIDTLESGEILGNHHGTYRDGLWWWNSRGYTPAGVECWNGMRALDYLSTRPEVDTNRFGITGRSGGGAYSWFVTAMDDRIKAAAPTAGITDLENYVVDGAVEGHCDCMFFVNTYRWDYPQLAALAAPRPLLICNTDDDNIFPLDGVVRLRDKVRRVYDLLGAGEKCGLVITPGPHKDTQELQVPVMRWFNHYLKGEDTLVENAAVKLFSPEQLKVFDKSPSDAINTNVHFTFVEAAGVEMPKSKVDWERQRNIWLAALKEESFAARLTAQASKDAQETLLRALQISGSMGSGIYPPERFVDGVMGKKDEPVVAGNWERGIYRVQHFPDCTELAYVRPSKSKPKRFVLGIPPSSLSAEEPRPVPDAIVANMSVRAGAVGVTAESKKQTQIRRRFMLLGETIDSMRVSDIVHTIWAIHPHIFPEGELSKLPIRLEASGDMAVNALYASLFAPVDELILTDLPKSHMDTSVDYLNVLRILDIPQAVAMASERCRVELHGANEADWQYPLQTTRTLGWEKNLRVVAE